MTKYIFITGGVMSSLGKGITASSLGALLQSRGYKVRIRKFDPYLNIDPGTMNPKQHGEVFVTDDGAETDLDLGHYERFTGINVCSDDAITMGQVYADVIFKERKGDYLGSTVQVVPHITNHIQQLITKNITNDIDFLICEAGGTVGDIEGLSLIEAIRQFSNKIGYMKSIHIHLTYLPYIDSIKELKTKPCQHAVKSLLQLGIRLDILLCRCTKPLPDYVRHKLSLFCNVSPKNILEALDVDNIYKIPLLYQKNGLDLRILEHFKIKNNNKTNISLWENFVNKEKDFVCEVQISIVGKYIELSDAYKSILEALIHSGIENNIKVKIIWIDSEDLEVIKDGNIIPLDLIKVAKIMNNVDGIIVPGGYGIRGSVGKMVAITFARNYKIPFLGICFGMQLSVIEFLRNVVGMQHASSEEFGLTNYPVICHLRSLNKSNNLGGTMRLGAYPSLLSKGTLAYKIYKNLRIVERHRHRYEVNMFYHKILEDHGMIFSGISPDGCLAEIIELNNHPWYLAVQFHPEFKSRPFKPHPIFSSFLKAVASLQ